MGWANDLTGKVFGRLTVLQLDGLMGRNAASLCQCSCGKTKRILNQNLLNGGTQSCGCLASERASARVKKNPPRLKHGLRRTSTYACWQGMVDRCLNPNNHNYQRYGGRGVRVISRWSDPDKGALNFIEDMGHRPSSAHSIDRIDGTKGYEPGNCRWATRAQQNQNVGLKKSNSSGYKGITQLPSGRWSADVRNDGKRYYLGTYATKERAALAYNVAAERLQGEFAFCNALPHMTKKETNWVFRKVKNILKRKDKT